MLTLLRNIPIIGPVIGLFQDNARLAIEYALIGLVVASAGLSLSLWISKERFQTKLANAETNIVQVESRLKTVEFVNDQQENTITNLKELRLKDAEALTGLMTDFQSLANADTRARRQLDHLEKSNEVVRDYLNQPIPPVLACVLNGTCTAPRDQGGGAAGASPPAKGPSPTVPAPRSKGPGADKGPS